LGNPAKRFCASYERGGLREVRKVQVNAPLGFVDKLIEVILRQP